MSTEEYKEIQEITLQDGRRVWLFGCTVFCIWLLIYMVALILVASSTVSRVPRSALKAYSICVSAVSKMSEKSRKRMKCAIPKPVVQKGVSAKIIDVGYPPWIAVLVVFLFCGIFYLMQSTEDWKRTREALQIGTVYANKNASLSDVSKVFTETVDQAGKVVTTIREGMVESDTKKSKKIAKVEEPSEN